MLSSREHLPLIAVIFAVALGCGLLSSQSAAQTMAAQSPVAVVLQVSGDVQAERAGAVDDSPGRLDLLYPGDTWRTGSNGQLAVRFIDNTLVRFEPNTSVVVARDELELQLSLRTGGVDMARFTASAGPALLRVSDGNGAESVTATESGLMVRRPEGGALETARATDQEQLRAIAQLAPDNWAWLAGDSGQGSGLAPGEQNLVERYRERTSLPVPELMVTEEIAQIVRQSAAPSTPVPTPPEPSEPEPAPEPEPVAPAVSPEEQFQQDLDTIVAELAALLREGQSQQALALAESRRLDFEGEPDFDLLYGRAALNQGQYQRSSFALERAMINYPDQPAVRLTLVEAYLGLGNTQAAGRQLQRAAEYDLTERQQARWNRLDEIRRQLELRNQITENYSVSGQSFYNTNLNQGLSCSTCNIDGIDTPVEFDEDSQVQSGVGVSAQGRYDRVTPLSQRERRTLAAGLNARLTSLESANSIGGLFSYGQEWDPGRRVSADLLPGWSPSRVSLTAAVNGGIDDVWESRDLTGTFSVSANDQPSQSAQLNVSLADDWAWAESNGEVTGRWQVGNLINLGSDSAQHYIGASLSVTPSWTPEGMWVYQGVASYQLQQYLDNETFAGDLQRNHQFQFGATALRPLNESTQVSVDARWQQVISNQELAEFGALEIALGVQHRW